ncbi:MAG TPA: calcium/proton exchanger [Solirubrobacteraceae bacterium]|jgi:Ca2+:H+ antiporter|nr:calcium/proton exchanger [Solirubrobacteraceae bacterium]
MLHILLPVSSPPRRGGPLAAMRPIRERWPFALAPFIVLAVLLDVVGGPAILTFLSSALAVIPLAALIGRATEELADRSGPGIGGLVNVTFGNAPELIIALFALGSGLHEVVKASLVGSILGNVLLVMGGAMAAGGARRDRQVFNGTAASAQSSALMLAASAVILPAVYELAHGGRLPAADAQLIDYNGSIIHLSVAIAAIMMLGYASLMLFSLRTHRQLFNPPQEESERTPWPLRRSVGLLAVGGLATAGVSEILVGSITQAARSAGLSQFFVGAVAVAIVGNAAEHWVAVSMAAKDKVDLAVNIAIGSSSQIALFVLPALVLCSTFIGPHPMALLLNGYELAALVLAILIAVQVTGRGESTWLDGVQLMGVYTVVVLTFAFA